MLTHGNLIEMMRTLGYHFESSYSNNHSPAFSFDDEKLLIFHDWEELADWLHETYD